MIFLRGNDLTHMEAVILQGGYTGLKVNNDKGTTEPQSGQGPTASVKIPGPVLHTFMEVTTDNDKPLVTPVVRWRRAYELLRNRKTLSPKCTNKERLQNVHAQTFKVNRWQRAFEQLKHQGLLNNDNPNISDSQKVSPIIRWRKAFEALKKLKFLHNDHCASVREDNHALESEFCSDLDNDEFGLDKKLPSYRWRRALVLLKTMKQQPVKQVEDQCNNEMSIENNSKTVSPKELWSRAFRLINEARKRYGHSDLIRHLFPEDFVSEGDTILYCNNQSQTGDKRNGHFRETPVTESNTKKPWKRARYLLKSAEA